MNFFEQGIPLGRWWGITVVIHWTFLLYAANDLLSDDTQKIAFSALYLGLLFSTVLVHEFGHALSCKAVGGEAYHIVLWPLGGIAFVQPPNKAWAAFVTTFCGPLVNALLWPLSYFLARFLVTQHYGPAAWDSVLAEPDTLWINLTLLEQICIMMWKINRMLLLFNLIPAYPLDGGRLLQEVLWLVVGYGRSLRIAGMVGTVAGFALVVLGSGLQPILIPGINETIGATVNVWLIVIGLLSMWQSFSIYQRSREIKTWRKN